MNPPPPVPDRWFRPAFWGLLGTGLVLGAYVRPGFDRLRPGLEPSRVGFHLELVEVVRFGHVAAAVVAGVCLAVALVLRVRRKAERGRASTPLAASGVAIVLALGTGLVVPWERHRPWAPGIGRNMARPAVVTEAEGPFPELVGVNATYELGRVPVLGGRAALGPWGIGAVVAVHVVALPLALLLVRLRRRARG